MSGPLSGLKILDFTGLLPGPFATMMLADMGADVLRIEAPKRLDLLRLMRPQYHGSSSAHAQLNRGKRSLGIDLSIPAAKDLVVELIENAGYDILFEGFRPGVMKKLGLGYEELSQRFPQLIYCSMTGFGQDGPRAKTAGHDINYMALSGVSSYTGRKDSGPAPQGLQVADLAGGSCHSVIAMLAAVIHRQATGEGQHCDIAITDATLALNALFGPGFLESEQDPDFESLELNGSSLYDYYRCFDGRYLAFGGLEPKFVAAFLGTLGKEDWLPKLADPKLPASDIATLKSEIAYDISQHPLAHWLELFSRVDACVSAVQNLSEVAADPHFKARDMIVCVDDEAGNQRRQIGSPFKFSKTRTTMGHAGCPLGAHNDIVLQRELGYSQQKMSDLQKQGIFG